MIDFVKMHGNGNDFVMVDEWDGEVVSGKTEFSSRYCDRRFGIGADGVIFVQRSDNADIQMVLYQPDGAEAEMCGNGVRCLLRYAVELGHIEPDTYVDVETVSGIRRSHYNSDDGFVSVDMGTPSFDPEDVPAKRSLIEGELGGYTVTACNTGVPHAVIFVDNVDRIDVEGEAPEIRHSEVFPEGANVNFASESDDGYRVRTFERGVEAETWSCGTGSVAVAAVARKLGKAGDDVLIHTRGGDLEITFKDGKAFKRGPAERVYEGSIDVSF